jgi:gliding motility-associated-like protein
MEFESAPSEVDELGYIDICQGETVTITADGVFPYSIGTGYNQTNENSFFEWDLGDGTELSGYGLTTVTNTYALQFGYPIELVVTDTLGMQQRYELAVRVSTTPNFTGLIAQYQEQICLGNSTVLIGGIAQDTSQSFGVLPVQSSFIGGGFLAGQTFLPDGSGASYETVITLDDFPIGSSLENAEDVIAICATMEHSYLGDLDITLTCPNGTTIILQDQSGGSCNLGEPWATGPVDGQSSNTTPGVGYEYCWTADATGTMVEACGQNNMAFNNGNGPATYNDSFVPAGDYIPFDPLSDLIGCPINGEWTITVTDNLGADNGYIFSWGIQFDPAIDPTIETYVPLLIEGFWNDAPSIISNNDTIIDVSPTEIGFFQYTFNVTDNFGCTYDTTIVLEVLPPVSASVFPPACNLSLEYVVENQYAGGTWSYTSDYDDSLFVIGVGGSDIDVSAPGFYILSYFDNFCQTTIEADVEFLPFPLADILPDTTELCSGQEEFLTTTEQINGLQVNYQWTYDSLGTQYFLGSEATQAVYFGGEYEVQIIDVLCSNFAADVSYVLEEPCIIETYNVFTPNGDGENDFFYIQAIEKFKNPVVYVYNRWGNVVFEKSNYRNDWDMADMSEGTYFYVILNPANSESFKGSFTLLR